MRTAKNISVTMPSAMIKEAEKLARKENRTMSELIREAFRQYQLEQEWQRILAYGRAKAKALGIKESDVVPLIQQYRREKRAKDKLS